jgi:hypothetical protein
MILNDNDSIFQVLDAHETPTGWEINDANFNLVFNPENQFEISRLTFKSSNITIQNLNLIGSLAFENCNVTIIDSEITQNQLENEFVLLADLKTTLIASNLKMNGKSINLIVIEHQSICSFTNCIMSNFQIAIQVNNQSKVFFIKSELKNDSEIPNFQFASVSNSSFIQAIESTFQNCTNHGIIASNKSFVSISKCTFSDFS